MKAKNLFIKNYFFGLSIAILILGLLAFSDNLITDVGQESNFDPQFIMHGLIMFAWIFVLVVQTNRIRSLNYKGHIRFGIIGFVIGILMILSIVYLHWFRGLQWDELPFFAKANRLFVPAFAIMLAFAYMNRNKSTIHKYLIFSGMLLLMEPMISRVGEITGEIVAVLIWLGLWVSLFVYDIFIRRKVHPIIYLSFAYLVVVYFIVI